MAFDKGLIRSVSLEINGKKHEEKQAYLLSRSAWIDQIEQKTDENFEGFQGVIMLDIAGLNNANKVTEDGSIGGDFLLQRTAKLLNQALDEINPDLINSFDFIPCRYGGDEFAVAIIKKKDAVFNQKIDLESILAEIRKKITSEKAFYNRDGEVKEELIALKEKETKAISMPTNEVDRLIFISLLRSGIVIDADDIEIIKMIFTENGEVDKQAIKDHFRKYYIQEPDYETEAESLKNDLINKHPEFSASLHLANFLDKKDEEENGQTSEKRLISLLKFIKKSLGDRLLNGERVLSFNDFQEHLKIKEFEQVVGIEMKFVKELNDHFSMVIADDIIKQFFNYLKNKIDDTILSRLYIYRRGGSFFIGVKKGANLPEDFYQKLEFVASNFSVLNILGRKTSSLNIPLSFKVWDNPDIDKLKEFMDSLDEYWYSKVPEDVREKVKNGDIKLPEKPKTIDQLFAQLTLDNLYLLFFGSEKRGKERIEKLSTS